MSDSAYVKRGRPRRLEAHHAPPSPRRQTVIIVVVLLLLSGVICYGVAAACSYHASPSLSGWGNYEARGNTAWSSSVVSDFGFDLFALKNERSMWAPAVSADLKHRRVPRWVDLSDTGSDRVQRAYVITAGWPLRCVRCVAGPHDQGSQPQFNGGALISRPNGWYSNGTAIVVPFVPIWLPFLASTLLLFLLLWSLTAGPFAVRRFLRRRRGRCLRCGYLLVTSTCSECGAAARAAQRPAGLM